MSVVVTGASGFIGSNLVHGLNTAGYTDLILVDEFETPAKQINLQGAVFTRKVHRDVFPDWFREAGAEVSFVFHLGARTDTAEFNFRVLDSLNLSYSKTIWEICTARGIPLIYASSAATYGKGEHGFSDEHALLPRLQPLNPYGLSKHLFDLYTTEQQNCPPFWCGVKFFNVYGPREQHKGRMASVVYHAIRQIRETGQVKLFKSHRPEYQDGEQLRDFIYIDDVIRALMHLFTHYRSGHIANGIYNLGTGRAQSFRQLATAVFQAMGKPVNIVFIPTPDDIRDKYQYFTEADMRKLHATGFEGPYLTLQEAAPLYLAQAGL
ncbi:MAG: ADP-glyceromanno-heptose 6-epimerase [Chitinophagales bacterium]|nr:ADP-glyceromanno-heptose 6-epimerase [Chitinophagales bacterium]MDW8420120.1 ADP-glyceromanno-heptose 6-epimerase [Chitinophagales bacterium]